MQGKAMTEDAMPPVYVGIDVCKDRLDVYMHPLGERFAVPNRKTGWRALVRRLARSKVALVVLEPTSTYHRAAHRCLHAAGIAVSPFSPLRARRFAEAMGEHAKTDAIDARILALVGERLKPDPAAPVGQAQEALQELVGARAAALAERVAVRNRLETVSDGFVRRELKARLRSLDAHVERLDQEIAARIAADPALAHRIAILTSIPGVGTVTAVALAVDLQELGQLTGKEVAALAGLAPFARDSGPRRGERHISGGRPAPRSALYMAALGASRFNPELKRFYQRLIEQGKAPKLALTAIARKLVVLANTLLAQDRHWQTR